MSFNRSSIKPWAPPSAFSKLAIMMQQQLQSVASFIVATAAALDSAAVDGVRATQTTHLATLFKRTESSVDDAAATLRLLSGEGEQAVNITTAFTNDQHKLLASAVATRMGGGGVVSSPASSARAQVQTHLHMSNYLTRAEWTQLMDASIPMRDKINILVDRSLQIGLCNPSELSVVSIIAGLSVATCTTLGPDESHSLLKEFKRIIKVRRVGVAQTVVTFPKEVSDFMALHGDCYSADHAPIACPVSVDAIERLRLSMGARKTHKTLSQASSSSMPAVGVNMMQQCVQHCVSAMMDQFTGSTSKMPNITMLRPGQSSSSIDNRASSALPLPAQPPMLAFITCSPAL